MENNRSSYIGNVLVATTILGLGIAGLAFCKRQEERSLQESVYFENVFRSTKVKVGSDLSDLEGQRFLDSFGVKYSLKDGEDVVIDRPLVVNEAYIGVRDSVNREIVHLKEIGISIKDLERYLNSVRN
ncbi:MAG: hypothetical protein WCI72_04960 [archaeon]